MRSNLLKQPKHVNTNPLHTKKIRVQNHHHANQYETHKKHKKPTPTHFNYQYNRIHHHKHQKQVPTQIRFPNTKNQRTL